MVGKNKQNESLKAKTGQVSPRNWILEKRRQGKRLILCGRGIAKAKRDTAAQHAWNGEGHGQRTQEKGARGGGVSKTKRTVELHRPLAML